MFSSKNSDEMIDLAFDLENALSTLVIYLYRNGLEGIEDAIEIIYEDLPKPDMQVIESLYEVMLENKEKVQERLGNICEEEFMKLDEPNQYIAIAQEILHGTFFREDTDTNVDTKVDTDIEI